MKLNIHTDGVIITAKQKSLMERKILKLKKYLPGEAVKVDLVLRDETSSEKGGIDQQVHISATFGKEKIFIEEVDDRLMRAFVLAMKRFERQLSRYHKRRVDDHKKAGEGRFDKLLKFVRRKKKK